MPRETMAISPRSRSARRTLRGSATSLETWHTVSASSGNSAFSVINGTMPRAPTPHMALATRAMRAVEMRLADAPQPAARVSRSAITRPWVSGSVSSITIIKMQDSTQNSAIDVPNVSDGAAYPTMVGKNEPIARPPL